MAHSSMHAFPPLKMTMMVKQIVSFALQYTNVQQYSVKHIFDIFSRLVMDYECDRQTDRRTDTQNGL